MVCGVKTLVEYTEQDQLELDTRSEREKQFMKMLGYKEEYTQVDMYSYIKGTENNKDGKDKESK